MSTTLVLRCHFSARVHDVIECSDRVTAGNLAWGGFAHRFMEGRTGHYGVWFRHLWHVLSAAYPM